MCNREVCLNSMQDSIISSEDISDSNNEFFNNIGHCKCKVVGLIRQQMQKLQCECLSDESETFFSPSTDERQWPIEKAVQTHTEVVERGTEHENPGYRPIFSMNWAIKQNLPQFNHLYKYKKVAVASFVILVLVWMALVLGALLGASICGDKRTCLPVFQLESRIRSKHSLF